MIGRAAITQRDDGTPADPRTDAEWLDWVPAGAVRNWCADDLLLDWLAEFGERAGFRRDDQLPGYDATFDPSPAVLEPCARIPDRQRG